MTTSEVDPQPTTAYVWVWLPGATEPVVASRLDKDGSVIRHTYGRSYLDRKDAIPLWLPDLPLEPGPTAPTVGELHGCFADAGPDAWGRRVVEHRYADGPDDMNELGYLLATGSDRTGALDFQSSADTYNPRVDGGATLEDLARAADAVETGSPLPIALEAALVHGSSIGGARPKARLTDGTRQFIAKFSSKGDPDPVVRWEYAAMELARRVGLDVAPVELTSSAGKDVLLVERFDRTAGGERRLMVSALTILGLDELGGRYATYADLADQVRVRFTDPLTTLRELFSRIVFNILVSNTDDHARNHAAFWDGRSLALTPAYDICPQNRTGGVAEQAMAIGHDGYRSSQLAGCITRASVYQLDTRQAQEIVDTQVAVINDQWKTVADQAKLTPAEQARAWHRQILNPYAFYDNP
jgi:serine/threonine-protein kinase HipA